MGNSATITERRRACEFEWREHPRAMCLKEDRRNETNVKDLAELGEGLELRDQREPGQCLLEKKRGA